jgi:hypothetical protein
VRLLQTLTWSSRGLGAERSTTLGAEHQPKIPFFDRGTFEQFVGLGS